MGARKRFYVGGRMTARKTWVIYDGESTAENLTIDDEFPAIAEAYGKLEAFLVRDALNEYSKKVAI